MKYQIPKLIDVYQPMLARLYANEDNPELANIVVNSRLQVDEAVSEYQNYSQDNTGHDVIFTMQESLFLSIFRRKERIAKTIAEDLNKLISVRGEYISDVSFRVDEIEDVDWRRNSGFLVTGEKSISEKQTNRVWRSGMFRLFVSHRSSTARQVAEFSNEISKFGISAFVAHQDIQPTSQWRVEIMNALSTMDALLAVITDDFHGSDWTDQEVGWALGRGVPVVSASFNQTPYGLMDVFQALRGDWPQLPLDVSRLLLKDSRMVDAYIYALQSCRVLDDANMLSKCLPSIEVLDAGQTRKLVRAYNANSTLKLSYGFNGTRPSGYGPGLSYHLTRLTGQPHEILTDGVLSPSAPDNAIDVTSASDDSLPF